MPAWCLLGKLAVIVLLAETGLVRSGDFEDIGAVYESRDWQAKVDGNKARLHARDRLVILNRRGERYAHLYVSEHPFRKVKSAKVTVMDENGQPVFEYSKGDFQKHCGFGESFQLYSGNCIYELSVPCVSFPLIIEWERNIELKSLFFLHGVDWDSDIPARSVHFELSAPKDLGVQFKVYDSDLRFDSTLNGKEIKYEWTGEYTSSSAEDTVSTSEESRAGTIAIFCNRFELGGVDFRGDSWKEIGAWYRDLLKDRIDLDAELKSGEPRDSGDRRRLITEEYDFVRTGVRYVSVSIGVGGWQPRRIDDIVSTGYGDCKDVSTLLISRLRERGIAAYPALVLTRDIGMLDVDFPNLDFNHVITAAVIDEDTLWMDPTCSVCQIGDLPYQVENIKALLVNEYGGQITTTGSSEPEENLLQSSVRITVDDLRCLEGTAVLSFRGNPANRLRYRLPHATAEETRRMVETWLKEDLQLADPNELNIQGLAQSGGLLVVSFRFRNKRPLLNIGEALYLDPFVFDRCGMFDRREAADRDRVVQLGYPRSVCDSVTVIWEAEAIVDSVRLPDDTSFHNEVYGLAASAAMSRDSVFLCRRYTQHIYDLTPANVHKYNDLNSAVRALDKERLKYYLR